MWQSQSPALPHPLTGTALLNYLSYAQRLLSGELVFYDLDATLGLGVGSTGGTAEDCLQVVGEGLVTAQSALLKDDTFLETVEETTCIVVVARESDAICALHVDGLVCAVLLQDLNVADGVALTVDGESEA